MRTYQQLTESQRCQIEMLKKIGMKQNKLAEFVGVVPSTVSRELKRNKGARGYRHQQAQRKADERRGGDLHTHLRRQGKKYQKRSSAKGSRGQIKNRVSIDKRPADYCGTQDAIYLIGTD